MKNLLLITFLLVILSAGCVESFEEKYEDPENSGNYIILNPSSGSFTIVTEEFTAGGSYSETSESYNLEYSDYPVGVTLKKVDGGVEIVKGVMWKKVSGATSSDLLEEAAYYNQGNQ